jgi:hypothetical protein
MTNPKPTAAVEDAIKSLNETAEALETWCKSGEINIPDRAKMAREIRVLIAAATRAQPQSAGCDVLANALAEIREIYCNMEGFIPETAPEGYCLQEIKKMYDVAVNALKALKSPPVADKCPEYDCNICGGTVNFSKDGKPSIDFSMQGRTKK